MDSERIDRIVKSWIWTLIPVVTFGLAGPLAFGFGAILRRSGRLALVALGYAAVIGLEILAIAALSPPIEDVVFWLCVAITVPGAFVHAVLVRRWVFDLRKGREHLEEEPVGAGVGGGSAHGSAYGEPTTPMMRPPEFAGQRHGGGAGPAANGPAHAAGAYALNLNHASAPEIQHLTGLPIDHAEHIVRIRAQVGGFRELDHLTYATGLPRGHLDHIAGRVRF